MPLSNIQLCSETRASSQQLIAEKTTVYVVEKDSMGRPSKFSPGKVVATDFNPNNSSRPNNFQIRLNSGVVLWVSADNLMTTITNADLSSAR